MPLQSRRSRTAPWLALSLITVLFAGSSACSSETNSPGATADSLHTDVHDPDATLVGDTDDAAVGDVDVSDAADSEDGEDGADGEGGAQDTGAEEHTYPPADTGGSWVPDDTATSDGETLLDSADGTAAPDAEGDAAPLPDGASSDSASFDGGATDAVTTDAVGADMSQGADATETDASAQDADDDVTSDDGAGDLSDASISDDASVVGDTSVANDAAGAGADGASVDTVPLPPACTSNAACDDGNPCTDDSCAPDSGCVALANSATCSDGDTCTSSDTCASSKCVGKKVDCDDDNVCTDDSCVAQLGCVALPNQATCSDGDACTTGDQCDNKACKAAQKTVCDDGNACTSDACDKDKGCVSLPSQASCSDGDACTQSDVCKDKACVSGPKNACDDGNVCTTDACDSKSGCTAVANQAACQDGDACTSGDQCAQKACVGGKKLSCDDGNLCTDDSCDSKTGCKSAANQASCSDGNACTTGDSCVDKSCKGTEKTCTDNNPCTTDSCDTKKGCLSLPNSLTCTDDDACTTGDACSGGKCAGQTRNCDDTNPCTNDSCDKKTGCLHKTNSAPCDDGKPCTVDQCAGGKCVGIAKTCAGHACAASTCDTKTGACVATKVADGTACGGDRICVSGGCATPFATQVSASRQLTCALRSGGAVWCWGSNAYGQLGRGDTKSHAKGAATGVSKTRRLAVGMRHVCAVSDSGAVRCWGNSTYGQVGTGSKSSAVTTPKPVSGVPPTSKIHAGRYHTLAVTPAGVPYTWGANFYRTVWPTDGATRTKPVKFPDVSGAEKWGAGGYQSCTLTAGSLRCWGRNLSGELGFGFVSKYVLARQLVVQLSDVTQFGVGDYHVCAVRKTGEVRCWGSGTSGQLGHGTAASSSSPVVVKGLLDATHVSAGSTHSCAVRQTGQVVCWGRNTYGQLGDGTKTSRTTATPVKSGLLFKSVSAGTFHTCGLLRSGGVACWGYNTSWGELGWSKKGQWTAPAVVPGTSAVGPKGCLKKGDCGAEEACFAWSCEANKCVSTLSKDKAACDDGDPCTTSEFCADGRCTGGSAKCDDGNPCTIDLCAPSSGKCTTANSTAICDDGSACTWQDRCKAGGCVGSVKSCDDGNSCTSDSCDKKTGKCASKPTSDGEKCSDGDACTASETCSGGVCKSTASPKVCAQDDNPCTLAVCGGAASCLDVPRPNGTACGGDQICSSGACTTPFATQISAGWETTCVRRPGGTAMCWGRGGQGERGTGAVVDSFAPPSTVKGLTDVVRITAGAYATCATSKSGGGYCWGWNGAGQTGSGGAGGKALSPVAVKTLKGVTNIQSGYGYACTTIVGGRVYCMGASTKGERNVVSSGLVSTPKSLAAVPQLTSLSSMSRFSCGIAEDSRVHCWGDNTIGQSGRGGYSATVKAAPVFGPLKAVSVDVGYYHACALTPKGHVWCWGSNSYGQLGDGTQIHSPRPVKVAILDQVIAVDVGGNHSCALRADHSVWCWGLSNSGQTGASYDKNVVLPTRVVSGGVAQVSAGLTHTCILTLAGIPRCWGSNKYGALGIGKTSWGVTRSPKTVTGAKSQPPPSCNQDSDCKGAGPCVTIVCKSGSCAPTPKKSGQKCSTGNACMTEGKCQSGTCEAAFKCDDGKPCTLASCTGGKCVQSNISAPCDDGNPCTLSQACAQGSCTAGTPRNCNDGDPCTTDACDSLTGACTHKPGSCSGSTLISGTVTFDHVPLLNKRQGGIKLAYDKKVKLPARRVLVQAIRKGQQVAQTHTNDAGQYALSVPKGLKVTIRALARVRIDGAAKDGIGDDNCDGASFDVRVVDNTNSKSLYVLQPYGEMTAPKSGVNLHAAMVYSGGKYQKRSAAPFAILDSSLQSIETACQGKKDLKLPLLTINWSINNAPVSGDKKKGQVGSANHFTTEAGKPQIYLKGLEDVSTAEYSRHTIAHEFGHYLERFLFRSDTIGGNHAFGQMLSMRTAFGEGYGNGLSGMVWGDPIYVASSGKGQASGFEVDFGTVPSAGDASFHSETTVAHVLYHLWDRRDTKANSGSFDRIYQILSGPQRQSPARTSLLTFVAWYNALFGSEAEGLRGLIENNAQTPLDAVCLGSCKGKGDHADVFDSNNDLGQAYAPRLHYPNNKSALKSPAFWQAYPLLKLGINKANGHDSLDSAGYKAPFNKAGGVRHYRLVGTGQKLTVRLKNVVGGACSSDLLNLLVYQQANTVAFDTKKTGSTAGCPVVSFQSMPDTVYVVTVQFPYTDTVTAVQSWDVEVSQ
ncbi:MAG: hypothetical protein KC502_08615 [Myxococcales bacterium]|nr:hypothetical protein [Myxococcales bacterium]